MKTVATIILVALTHQVVLGKFSTPCREVVPARDFDIGRYSGKEWYNIEYAVNDGRNMTPSVSKCESESFTSTSVSNVYRVNADGVSTVDGRNMSSSLHVTLDRNNTGIMHFEVEGVQQTAVILATDYESWSLFYRCAAVQGRMMETTVIRSRARTLDADVHHFLTSWVLGMGFQPENIFQETQTGC